MDRDLYPDAAQVNDRQQTLSRVNLLPGGNVGGDDRAGNRRPDGDARRRVGLLFSSGFRLRSGGLILVFGSSGTFKIRLRLPQSELGGLKLFERYRAAVIESFGALHFG